MSIKMKCPSCELEHERPGSRRSLSELPNHGHGACGDDERDDLRDTIVSMAARTWKVSAATREALRTPALPREWVKAS